MRRNVFLFALILLFSPFIITMLVESLTMMLALANNGFAETFYTILFLLWHMFAPILYLCICRLYRRRHPLNIIAAVVLVFMTNLINLLKMDNFSGLQSLLNFFRTGTGDEIMLILPLLIVVSNLIILIFSYPILRSKQNDTHKT